MMDDYKEMLDEAPPPRPAFLKRFWMVFVQPGELFRALGKNPAWFPMALFVGVVTGVSVAALPAEMWEAQMGGAGTGESFPQEALLLIRGAVALASSAALVLMTLVVSSVTYVVFVFMRGDNVVFKQHLAVVSHAGIVLLVGALVHLPLQIRSGDFEQSLSIGTFFPFLSDGFLLNFFNQLQLFGLWTTVAAGIGLAALAERRSAGSTIAVLLVMQVILALACAGVATAFSPTF